MPTNQAAKSAATAPRTPRAALQPLRGVRILSLALNLPGPAALMRCQQMGARCTKLEPPPHPSGAMGKSGDPMGSYNPKAYATLHAGIKVVARRPEDRSRPKGPAPSCWPRPTCCSLRFAPAR